MLNCMGTSGSVTGIAIKRRTAVIIQDVLGFVAERGPQGIVAGHLRRKKIVLRMQSSTEMCGSPGRVQTRTRLIASIHLIRVFVRLVVEHGERAPVQIQRSVNHLNHRACARHVAELGRR